MSCGLMCTLRLYRVIMRAPTNLVILSSSSSNTQSSPSDTSVHTTVTELRGLLHSDVRCYLKLLICIYINVPIKVASEYILSFCCFTAYTQGDTWTGYKVRLITLVQASENTHTYTAPGWSTCSMVTTCRSPDLVHMGIIPSFTATSPTLRLSVKTR